MDLYTSLLCGNVADFESESIDCVCPKCEVIYCRKILWTGRGIPRIFCDRCKIQIAKLEDSSLDIEWD